MQTPQTQHNHKRNTTTNATESEVLLIHSNSTGFRDIINSLRNDDDEDDANSEENNNDDNEDCSKSEENNNTEGGKKRQPREDDFSEEEVFESNPGNVYKCENKFCKDFGKVFPFASRKAKHDV